jgi:hypothetical protein
MSPQLTELTGIPAETGTKTKESRAVTKEKQGVTLIIRPWNMVAKKIIEFFQTATTTEFRRYIFACFH